MPARERLAAEIARCRRLMAGVNDGLSAEHLRRYARELDDPGGLSAYPPAGARVPPSPYSTRADYVQRHPAP